MSALLCMQILWKLFICVSEIKWVVDKETTASVV
jgi:hypothetical protein